MIALPRQLFYVIRMTKVVLKVVLLALATFGFNARASAATSTGAIFVFANVTGSCGVQTTGSVNFGNVDTLSSGLIDSAGSISIRCASGTNYVVQMDGGRNGTIANRKMIFNANSLNYQIYTDLARATVFGDGLGGSATITGTGTGTTTVIPVYGRISDRTGANQPGTYTDSITVSIVF